MPVTYAHFRFGREAVSAMAPELQRLIASHQQLFDFGVHGPDLLFFHRPLVKNSVKQLGYDSHHLTGGDFFTAAAEACRVSREPEAAKSYLLGLLCHYALDRCCHPAVAKAEQTGLTHAGIEAAFDRYLMTQDGLDPVTHRTTTHLHPSRNSAGIIAPFFSPLSEQTVYRCQRGFVFYMDLIVAKGVKRRLLSLVMTLLRKRHLKHMMVSLTSRPEYAESDRQLSLCYTEALALVELLLPQLLLHLESGAPLGQDFHRSFAVDSQ